MTTQSDPPTGETPQEFLTFVINQQDYAIRISDILEIKTWQPTTALPGAPSAHLGIINLRGHIVPVLDLAALLHVEKNPSADTCALLIASVAGVPVGLKVDAVSDIIEVPVEQIADLPALTEGPTPAIVTHIATREAALVRIVTLENLPVHLAPAA